MRNTVWNFSTFFALCKRLHSRTQFGLRAPRRAPSQIALRFDGAASHLHHRLKIRTKKTELINQLGSFLFYSARRGGITFSYRGKSNQKRDIIQRREHRDP